MAKKRSKTRRLASNPARRHHTTAKRRKRASNPMKSHRRRSRNPRGSGIVSGGLGTLKNGFWALVGLTISVQLPQVLLGAKNTGPLGYAANFVAALIAGFGITKFAGPAAGQAATLGGGLYTVYRAVRDNFSPVGKFLSIQGMGDATCLGEILTGDRTYFPLPVAYGNDRAPIIPSQIAARPMPVAAGAGMGNYRRRVA